MTILAEFATVDIVLKSPAATRAVDAFALAIIKPERQIRKLFTHLVFQCPAFSKGHVAELRQTLADKRNVYFEGFVAGFDAVYPRSVQDLVGLEYGHLKNRLSEAKRHRNKILHGQLTKRNLTAEQLVAYVEDIRTWCSALGDSAWNELGYDGFGRNSFKKSEIPEIWRRFKTELASVADYEALICSKMERSRTKGERWTSA